MDRSYETWPLVSVVHYEGKINPTPTYQRYAVWSRDQQRLLMGSIYRGYDIPKLYLREIKDGGPFRYEAIDGQQRLRAVWDFFNNKYDLGERHTPELAGRTYDDLDTDDRKRFEHYQFNLVVIRDAVDAEIREMFCRLQNGKPLNSAEKRNATVSQMRDFVITLTEHPFFGSVRFGNQRMQHQQVAAQTVALELAGGPTDTRNTALAKLYEDHQTFKANGTVAARVRRVYDLLARAFPERAPELKRGLVISLYLLVTDLLGRFNLNGREGDVREFLIDFEHQRRADADEPNWVRFRERLSHASDSADSIGFRHHFLLERFHAFLPDLIPLDPQRGFTEQQRTAIYRRDDGRCNYCGTLVPWSQFHAGHVVAHSKGGSTTVKNGRVACA